MKNLFQPVNEWIWDPGEITPPGVNESYSANATSCSFMVIAEDEKVYTLIDISEMGGRTLSLTVGDFSSDDGLAWIQIEAMDSSNGEEKFTVDYYQVQNDFKKNMIFTLPQDCGDTLKVKFRHEYDSDGIEPPALIMLSNPQLVVYESHFLEHHKVLKANLPASVEPGSEHIYYVKNEDGSVDEYISAQDGVLVKVGFDATNLLKTIAELQQKIVDLQTSINSITYKRSGNNTNSAFQIYVNNKPQGDAYIIKQASQQGADMPNTEEPGPMQPIFNTSEEEAII